MSFGKNLDGLIVYLTSTTGNTTLSGFSFGSRPITQTYIPAPGNIIKQINFATTNTTRGLKQFVGIQFIGSKEESPYYMGSNQSVPTQEYITLNDNFVGFYGLLNFSYKTIYGIGAIMSY